MRNTHEEFENINARLVLLSYTRIGKTSDGCQFVVNFKHETVSIYCNIFVLIAIIIMAIISIINPYKLCYPILSVFLLAVVVLEELFKVKKEKVLMIPFVGVQYTTEYGLKVKKNIFTHWQDIDDFIINEVIHMQRIIYVLTMVVKDESKKTSLIPLFMETKPRLQCLQRIYQELETILNSKKREQDMNYY